MLYYCFAHLLQIEMFNEIMIESSARHVGGYPLLQFPVTMWTQQAVFRHSEMEKLDVKV